MKKTLLRNIKKKLLINRSVRSTLIRKFFEKSDYKRWSNYSNLMKGWDERTILMSKFVKSNTSSVLEFGAGRMVLKKHLPKTCIYYPSDIVDRGEGTIIYDLNSKKAYDFPFVDIIFFSGVIEYVNDVDFLIHFLSEFCETFIVSYAIFERNSKKRRTHGWVNDFTGKQLASVFFKNGFKLMDSTEWKAQNIYVFNKM